MGQIMVDTRSLAKAGAAVEDGVNDVSGAARKMMEASVNVIHGEVSRLTPVNTGTLRAATFTEVRGRSIDSLRGRVGNPTSYALPVETGRRPGKMPPVDAIWLWLRQRARGGGGAVGRGLAFVVARKIGVQGTRGRWMFRDGWKRSESKVRALWGHLPDLVVHGIRRRMR